MHTRTVRLLVLLLGVLVIGLAGCDPDMTMDPVLPGQISILEVKIDPNPVYESYSNIYRFRVSIHETNGLGAQISSIKVEYIDETDRVFKTETLHESDVRRYFGTSRIEALGTPLRTNVELEDCFTCKRQNWVVRAYDDFDNYVQASGSVKLISR